MQPLNSDEYYYALALKWIEGDISVDEKQEFLLWYNSGHDKEVTLPEGFAVDDNDLQLQIYSGIEKQIFNSRVRYFRERKWQAAAAAIFILLSTSLYFYSELHPLRAVLNSEHLLPNQRYDKRKEKKNESLVAGKDIAPAQDKAILTLGDGTKIILDDAQNGILASQSGNNILKTAEGELIYIFSKTSSSVESDDSRQSFNTIATPKGGKFQVKLADGSRVWLNAESSLTFSTDFNSNTREVKLTGEAYFEVAHDESKAFEIIAGNQKVRVLGTHFNINAYPDEPSVSTTLLEGSVTISDMRTNISQMLKPGEQAKLNDKIEILNVKDTRDAVAWKDGYFQFTNADIHAVMRQIGRWYDVSVRYEGTVPAQRFGGEIERSLSLLQVLSILEGSKVHFSLEGKEVVVMIK